MRRQIRINSDIAVGPQPSEPGLTRLHDDGFRAVVNLRTFGEHGQAISPETEARLAEDIGLAYRNIQVSRKEMAAEQVDMFRQALDVLPAPVYVHSGTGRRAAAFVMMHVAAEQDLTGDEVLAAGERRGLPVDSPKIRRFIKHYINELVPV